MRHRYRGQSGVEHAFELRVFSLAHASQHALTGAFVACVAISEERPVNMKSTTARSETITILKYSDCMISLYMSITKKSNDKIRNYYDKPRIEALEILHNMFDREEHDCRTDNNLDEFIT